MKIKIRKLTPNLAKDYVRFFDTTPHNQKHNLKCYCVCWCSGKPEGIDCSTDEKRREAALQYVKNGKLQGYLAYSGNQIVGWCNANTKADCLQCIRRYLMDSIPTDESADIKTKSIFCFTVAPELQRKGVAAQLLKRVCEDAAEDGFHFVEAYPNKLSTTESEDFMGYMEMYQKNGFIPVRETDDKYVMRKALKESFITKS